MTAAANELLRILMPWIVFTALMVIGVTIARRSQ